MSERITRCEAITQIVDSVALEQKALSYIINAEGDKIKKITEIAKTSAEMLAVNNSVQAMINSITKLEIVLQSKLELFKDCLCDDCKTSTDTGNDDDDDDGNDDKED